MVYVIFSLNAHDCHGGHHSDIAGLYNSKPFWVTFSFSILWAKNIYFLVKREKNGCQSDNYRIE